MESLSERWHSGRAMPICSMPNSQTGTAQLGDAIRTSSHIAPSGYKEAGDASPVLRIRPTERRLRYRRGRASGRIQRSRQRLLAGRQARPPRFAARRTLGARELIEMAPSSTVRQRPKEHGGQACGRLRRWYDCRRDIGIRALSLTGIHRGCDVIERLASRHRIGICGCSH